MCWDVYLVTRVTRPDFRNPNTKRCIYAFEVRMLSSCRHTYMCSQVCVGVLEPRIIHVISHFQAVETPIQPSKHAYLSTASCVSCMCQDNYLAEALKMRNMLMELRPSPASDDYGTSTPQPSSTGEH